LTFELLVALFVRQPVRMLSINASARTLIFVTFSCVFSGCASWSTPTVQPANVGSEQYLGMSCQQLKNEKRRIGTRQADLAPSLLAVEDEEKREHELSELSGEVKAIDKVRRSWHSCTIGWRCSRRDLPLSHLRFGVAKANNARTNNHDPHQG
jgi:hypothetical protein